jgi:hypothetical protein
MTKSSNAEVMDMAGAARGLEVAAALRRARPGGLFALCAWQCADSKGDNGLQRPIHASCVNFMPLRGKIC